MKKLKNAKKIVLKTHPDISKISQPQESAPPELRKLIRDIALWKLGKYGN